MYPPTLRNQLSQDTPLQQKNQVSEYKSPTGWKAKEGISPSITAPSQLHMADKSTSGILASSIHSEDLLSDMELLPASEPTTPAQRVPCSHSASLYSSKGMIQPYTSLRQCRQTEVPACSLLDSQSNRALAREPEAPEVDLDTLAEELSHRLSTGVEASSHRKGAAPTELRHISEMENVRCYLQNMLRGSKEAAHGDAVAPGTLERKDDDSFESDSTAALLNARPLQEVSPPGSLMGLEELFPRYTSLRLGQVREPSSYVDSHHLRDSLDKEQARRKHCERHIQTLQHRILELQQQLAVAVSADRKKDSMIKQLDKTLAKVVEGWNRHEAERTTALHRLQAEKEAAEQALGRQKEKVSEMEGRLENALSALNREQQAVKQYYKEKEMLEEEKASVLCDLEAARLQVRDLEGSWDVERRQQEALRATLEEQQQDWAQRERQLEQQRQALEDGSRSQLEMEKAMTQREAQKAADAQRVLASVQSEVQVLGTELEAVRRERDNLKMEISLVKARYEAQKVKLESELKVALEQRVTERLAEVHEESLRQMSAMREQHRKQLLELSSHHEKELANQLAQFKSDLAEREDRQRHLTAEYEHRISKQEEEIRELQVKHRRLEAQRAEMVGQFQAMMQAHWNEALRLFAGSGASFQTCVKPQQQDNPSVADPTVDPEAPSEALKKTQKVDFFENSQRAEDSKVSPWTQAVPLQPVTQRSKSQGPPEAPEKSILDPYQHFLHAFPDVGRLSSEFSHVFNYSLLSPQGFQQLEPQADTTVAGPGLTFHPENFAEHPFTDDTDETLTEGAGIEGQASHRNSSESSFQVPPYDLNHYIRLLWDHSVNESGAQKQEGFSMVRPTETTNKTEFGPSLSYHERSTALWDPAQPSTHSHSATQQCCCPQNQSAFAQNWTSLPNPGTTQSPEAETCPREWDPVSKAGG
uniref:Centrobin, centriole duplication and spindle assembly protein n=1 Tax=Anolis carolinensis TaxID=28377 RepID=A0A803T654_ANOCA|nr:PREDICTED: centrobin [Anolis carolinensis]XP_008117790.1 PREDICTED: centrobin [Anolis carolinensis]XP_008117791.1 PREDICTED: centrobin [Anolis carolinensis]|eukprot:XP_008117789.1 PREDICTED: centrobin [Anolis carolinensis]